MRAYPPRHRVYAVKYRYRLVSDAEWTQKPDNPWSDANRSKGDHLELVVIAADIKQVESAIAAFTLEHGWETSRWRENPEHKNLRAQVDLVECKLIDEYALDAREVL